MSESLCFTCSRALYFWYQWGSFLLYTFADGAPLFAAYFYPFISLLSGSQVESRWPLDCILATFYCKSASLDRKKTH